MLGLAQCTVAGLDVGMHFQRFVFSKEPARLQCELLSRPSGGLGVEDFLAGLSTDQHLDLLTFQLQVKERLAAAVGMSTTINIHNSVVESVAHRDRFLQIVAEYPAPTVFEFTETYPMPPVGVSNRLMRDLRELGHQSALDDFGIGLTGMSLLTDYDFDVVKIDRTLICDIDTRVEKYKTLLLVRQILTVLGKDHVVEGVESKEVLEMLAEAGFNTFQGFLFDRPSSVENLLTEAREMESVA
jgi:EAL domain-containing protein (putative c-di-GMP-specific phosphodiesterase class I)